MIREWAGSSLFFSSFRCSLIRSSNTNFCFLRFILDRYIGKYGTSFIPGLLWRSLTIRRCRVMFNRRFLERREVQYRPVSARWVGIFSRTGLSRAPDETTHDRRGWIIISQASVSDRYGQGSTATFDVWEDDGGYMKTSYGGCWGLAWSITTTTSNFIKLVRLVRLTSNNNYSIQIYCHANLIPATTTCSLMLVFFCWLLAYLIHLKFI